MCATPERWTHIIISSSHVPVPIGEYPKLLSSPSNILPRGFHFPPSPVLKSIGSIQIEFNRTMSDPLVFRLGPSSLAHLIFP